jgi:hypothetical protein
VFLPSKGLSRIEINVQDIPGIDTNVIVIDLSIGIFFLDFRRKNKDPVLFFSDGVSEVKPEMFEVRR